MRYIRDSVTGKAALIEDAAEFMEKYPSGKYRYLDFADDGTVTPFDPNEDKEMSTYLESISEDDEEEEYEEDGEYEEEEEDDDED